MNRAELVTLTEEEEKAGFRRLMIEWDGADDRELVVAYVLSDSDIVVKTQADGEIRYKHRRWGITRILGVNDDSDKDAGWVPVGFQLYKEPAEAIYKAEYEPGNMTFDPVERRKFWFEPYDPVKHGS